ncbi:hypothetical protein [Acidithiobacillus sp. AMEEHan]|uniref:hypothetical protein n=1 Tax=Acidithiobacillus sp. AMEEHan TaxID=2994951 RepID=UPI0027E58347|nr:hypothetical protein [Acidithiobacillus sp. AMEEHan]
MASGNSNQQSNNTALSATSNSYNHQSSTDYADASAGATQMSLYNTTSDTGVQDSATVDGNAAANASGTSPSTSLRRCAEPAGEWSGHGFYRLSQSHGQRLGAVEQVAYYNGGTTSVR